MEAEIKANKKKLKASLVLFILALIVLLAVIIYWVTPLKEVKGMVFMPSMAGVSFFLILISWTLNLSYRSEALYAGALSTTLFVVCSIVVIPALIIMVIALIFTGNLAMLLGAPGQGKTIKIIGDDGKEYKLTQKDSFGNEFTDQNGDLWMTQDRGETFKRVSVRIKDDNGNEVILTPRFGGNDEKYYQDENGNYWTTYNSGYSYEREDWRR